MLDIRTIPVQKARHSPHSRMSSPGKTTQKTSIVVLEEHPLFRHGIVDFFKSQSDLFVCGEADDIRDARDKIVKRKAHVLLTALRLGRATAWNSLRKEELYSRVFTSFIEGNP